MGVDCDAVWRDEVPRLLALLRVADASEQPAIAIEHAHAVAASEPEHPSPAIPRCIITPAMRIAREAQAMGRLSVPCATTSVSRRRVRRTRSSRCAARRWHGERPRRRSSAAATLRPRFARAHPCSTARRTCAASSVCVPNAVSTPNVTALRSPCATSSRSHIPVPAAACIQSRCRSLTSAGNGPMTAAIRARNCSGLSLVMTTPLAMRRFVDGGGKLSSGPV